MVAELGNILRALFAARAVTEFVALSLVSFSPRMSISFCCIVSSSLVQGWMKSHPFTF